MNETFNLSKVIQLLAQGYKIRHINWKEGGVCYFDDNHVLVVGYNSEKEPFEDVHATTPIADFYQVVAEPKQADEPEQEQPKCACCDKCISFVPFPTLVKVIEATGAKGMLNRDEGLYVFDGETVILIDNNDAVFTVELNPHMILSSDWVIANA